MNMQYLFDTVVAHARKQGARCVSVIIEEDTTIEDCAYRNENGMACFVGALIKDKYYYPEMEGMNIMGDSVKGAVENSLGRLLLDRELWLLKTLQTIHDSFMVEQWEREFMNIAEEYKLTYTPPA